MTWYRIDVAELAKFHVKPYRTLVGKFNTKLKKKWWTYLLTENRNLAFNTYRDLKRNNNRGYLGVRIKRFKNKPKYLFAR